MTLIGSPDPHGALAGSAEYGTDGRTVYWLVHAGLSRLPAGHGAGIRPTGNARYCTAQALIAAHLQVCESIGDGDDEEEGIRNKETRGVLLNDSIRGSITQRRCGKDGRAGAREWMLL
jgi:hypothetical protein